jgi:hypothetical protein
LFNAERYNYMTTPQKFAGSIVWTCKWLENTRFGKLDLFPSSGEGRDIATLLGSSERANLSSRGVSSVCTENGGCSETAIPKVHTKLRPTSSSHDSSAAATTDNSTKAIILAFSSEVCIGPKII